MSERATADRQADAGLLPKYERHIRIITDFCHSVLQLTYQSLIILPRSSVERATYHITDLRSLNLSMPVIDNIDMALSDLQLFLCDSEIVLIVVIPLYQLL